MCDSIANGVQRGGGTFTQPLANLVVSNSVTATNLFATTYYGDGGLLSNITTGLVQPLANLVVSNTVTTTNEAVSGTLTVTGAMTSNTANTTFFYDTFTIPYINTQLLNVAAVTGLTSANIQTLNVQSLFANSAVIYGANTLNVLGISNLNSVTTPKANVGALNVSSISNLNSLVTGTLNVSSISNLNSVTTPKANVGALNVSSISNLNSLVTGTLNVSSISNLNSLVTGTLNVSSISNLNSLVLVNNLYAANALSTTNIIAAGFTSNSTNTVFNFDTLTIPFVNSTTLNVAGNIFASNALSTTNVFASGQVVATGKSGVGVCPPIVYRQGGSATNWNTPGSNTTPNVYAITSGVVQMQCGANVMTSTTQFIPFPVAYTNNPTVLVTSYGTTGNIWVASITSSAFSVSANTALQFEWLSIGI
jgi:hypothetical protein